ncbi:MAG: tRNA (adenosine(37)-N6)-dimethylallyltransferase MiaA [Actinobacteria bacterium]|nr:tRNA (adenosine(37)-N6)-dimethylallyltransferase MiaA [Actinomycetota bacterium]
MSREPLAILGPTASGKSAVAMALAIGERGRELGVELVSIDAMQVYRGMDIGTAKPTAAEQSLVRHHLIDLVDATENFTVSRFQAEYRPVMADIESRGGMAILVGGTGLYLRAVVDDLEIPGQWPEVRAELENELETVGPEALHRRLQELDPAAATKMEPTNGRRIVRALEVCLGGGRTFSSYGPGVDVYPPSRVRQVALRWDREVLSRRIESRVLTMVEAGLLDEVTNLHATGLSPTAAQALGYKEMIDHLEGRSSLDEAVATTILRTRQFAVRQERWFRRDPRIEWFTVEDDPVTEVAPRLTATLA